MNPRSCGYLSNIADKVVSKKKVYAICSARKLGMLMFSNVNSEQQARFWSVDIGKTLSDMQTGSMSWHAYMHELPDFVWYVTSEAHAARQVLARVVMDGPLKGNKEDYANII
ncbi:hypothetical protein FCV25MIE_15469 [Fagus crenata]